MNKNVFIAVSVALNAVLAIALGFQRSQPSGTPEPEVRVITNVVKETPPQNPGAPQIVPGKSVDWRSVESEDYKRYIANLRAIGCPEETIRDIIVADVNKLFASRKAAGPKDEFKFWKAGQLIPGLSSEKMDEKMKIAKEKRDLLKELLGVDVVDPSELTKALNPLEEIFSFLPKEKQQKLTELETGYSSRALKLMGGKARPGPEEIAAIKQLRAEREAELATVLSPKEKEDYDLRLSQTAIRMRTTLGEFDATEQEFRDVFKLRKAFDDEFDTDLGGPRDEAGREKRAAGQIELDRQVKQVLGEERFSQYEHEREWSQSSLRNISEQHNIPKESVFKAFDVRRLAQEEAVRIRGDASLPQGQREAALSNIRSQSEAAFQQLLGEEGFRNYQRRGARWFEDISPTKR